VVKLTGDGALVEFPSVVDAVACAVEVQRSMAEHNAEVAPENEITFRVGVNLGDVIFDDDDIYGDGVNVGLRVPRTHPVPDPLPLAEAEQSIPPFSAAPICVQDSPGNIHRNSCCS
jgi:class 3 adenylate cyclase